MGLIHHSLPACVNPDVECCLYNIPTSGHRDIVTTKPDVLCLTTIKVRRKSQMIMFNERVNQECT